MPDIKVVTLDNLGTFKDKIEEIIDTKQDLLSFDSTPTANSDRPVTSAGIKSAIDAEATRATAAEGALGTRIDGLDLTQVGANGSYIKYISQADGQISAEANGFDLTLENATNNNAPTSKTVKDYVDDSIAALDVSTSGGEGKYIRSISETDGKISPTEISFDTSIPAEVTADNNKNAPTTKAVRDAINALDASISGLTASKTITALSEADGIIDATAADISIASSQVNDKVTTIAQDSDCIPTTTAVKNYVTASIEGLDVSDIAGFGAGKTLSTLAETDGKISATFQDISITQSQVSGLTTDLANKLDDSQLVTSWTATTTDTNIPSEKLTKDTLDTKVDKVSGSSLVEDTKVASYDAHLINTSNPHSVTKDQVGLGSVANTGDSDTPVENGTTKFTTGGAYTLKTSLETALGNHTGNTSNPHSVTKAQVGLGNVDNKSEATIKSDFTGSIASGNTGFVTGGDVYNHTSDTSNPHGVTAAQVGLGNVDNTSDINKPISTATQTALDAKLDDTQLVTSWAVTTSDSSIPSEKLVKDSLDNKVDKIVGSSLVADTKVSAYDAHLVNTSNPHSVTKAQVGLSDVDNKSAATLKSEFTGSIASGNTGFVTGGDVYTALDNLPEPMVFRGTLGSAESGATIQALPTASEHEGDTYKVITAGTYASIAAKVGDVFISNGTAWILIPAGDEDTDTWRNISVNGTELLGSAISSGALNLVNGDNITVTGSGNNITLGVASGYSIPSDTKQSDWDSKVASNSAITGATKCKITYDAKGLVTAGADLVASDIPALAYLPDSTKYGKTLSVSGTSLSLKDQDGNTLSTVTTQDTNDNQTIKGNGTAFGINDVINIKGSGIVSVTADTTDKEITISASHQSIKALDTTATTSQTIDANEPISGSGTITLHKVSKTGSYDDLLNKPTIPVDTNQKIKTASVTFGADDVIEIAAGSNVQIAGDSSNKTITISATDTTYSSLPAAQDGTDVSLVTTGEKYTWNKKSDLTISEAVSKLYDYTYGLQFGYMPVTNGNYMCSVTGYTGSSTAVVIPSAVFYDNHVYTVVEIVAEAFKDKASLTSVIIPDSVTSIGNAAFYGCSGLTSITISNSVTSIGSGAFNGCSALTSVTIPNSVTYIGGSMFAYCSRLTSITIPNSVTSISDGAFGYCTSLTSITIPNSVTSIGGHAFDSCTQLTSISIPDSVTTIGGSAFYGCRGLTSITIPDSVTFIGPFAFYGCTNLATITISQKIVHKIAGAPWEASGTTAIIYEGLKGNQDLTATAVGTLSAYDWSSLKANHTFTISSPSMSGLEQDYYDFADIKLSIVLDSGSTNQTVKLVKNAANKYSGILFIEESSNLYEITVYYNGSSLILRCATVY